MIDDTVTLMCKQKRNHFSFDPNPTVGRMDTPPLPIRAINFASPIKNTTEEPSQPAPELFLPAPDLIPAYPISNMRSSFAHNTGSLNMGKAQRGARLRHAFSFLRAFAWFARFASENIALARYAL